MAPALDFGLVSLFRKALEIFRSVLAINTADGVVLVVGCSHPGIERIVEAAVAVNPKIRLIVGGFHLVVAPDDIIAKAVAALKRAREVTPLSNAA